MLTSLHIKNFRGFKTLDFGSFKRLNLIVGQNNTGKTGLLEALTLLLWEPPGQCGSLPHLFRSVGGDRNENFWKWIFHKKEVKNAVEIRAQFNSLPEFGVWLGTGTGMPQGAFRPVGGIGGVKVCTLGQRETALHKTSIFLRRKKKQVEALLQKIEPDLQTIETLQTGKEPLLYADVGLSEMIPVTQMGQGFNRLLDIYSEILVAEAKVLLIDEVENGVHHSVLSTIWHGLHHAASEVDVQIFATTHSEECIRSAHEVFSDQANYDLSVIQLFRLPDGIQGRVLNRKHIEAAMAGEIELR